MSREIERRLLNERDVAKLYGWSPRTLQKWRVLGRGPCYLKAGGVKYRVSDVELWLESVPSGGGHQ